MQPSNKDSIANTFIVAIALCLFCSFLVSAAAVGLKTYQSRNVELDRKKNILEVTGFTADEIKQAGGIEALYEDRFETIVIDMETGKQALPELESALDAAGKDLGDDVLSKYDQFWASKSKKPAVSDKVPKEDDIVGIKYREKYSHVFILKSEDGAVAKYVLTCSQLRTLVDDERLSCDGAGFPNGRRFDVLRAERDPRAWRRSSK